jgi:hypothetical protein
MNSLGESMIFAIWLLTITSFVQADWERVHLWTEQDVLVSTYKHTGQIDKTLPEFPLYVTVSFNFKKTPAKRYSKVTYSAEAAFAAQFETQDYVKSSIMINGRPTGTLRARILFPDPSLDLLEYFFDTD